MNHRPIPIARARDLLIVDVSIPHGLRWRITRGSRSAGLPAGRLNEAGYYNVGIDGTAYRTARMIYAMVYGVDPGARVVDHIDGCRDNHDPANLRLLTRGENCRNTSSARGSSSRFVGVSIYKRTGRWRARLVRGGREVRSGYFATELEAARAYDEWRRELDPHASRVNFPLAGEHLPSAARPPEPDAQNDE